MRLVTFESLRPAATGLDAPPGRAPVDFEHLEYGRPGAFRLGAEIPSGPWAGRIADLNRALALRLDFEDAGAPEAEADAALPADMGLFLAYGARARDAAERILAWVVRCGGRWDAPDLVAAGVVREPGSVRLRAPVPRPGKIVAVARNYRAHAAERGQREAPPEPALFLKAPTSVAGPGDEIRPPRVVRQVDYEGELAAVLGAPLRDAEEDEALAAVAGYTVANDLTARDFQHARGQAFIGKSCDGFAPLGPALVTPDELGDPQDLMLRTTVSGELRQEARTKDMIFPVAAVLSFTSRLMTLEPGDVVLTGTPAGVGAGFDPPRWLGDGDVVEVEIERLGRLHNVLRWTPPDADQPSGA